MVKVPPPPLPRGIKTCTGTCGMELPATPDYFDRDNSKDDNLRVVCKACRAEARMIKERKGIDERIRMIDDASLRMLETISRSGSAVPHCAEIYQRLMEVFEGAGGFSTHFMAQYLSSRPGSTTRTKMLAVIMQMSMNVSASGAAQIPVELMDDEDLRNTLEAQAKRIYRIPYDDSRGAEKAS